MAWSPNGSYTTFKRAMADFAKAHSAFIEGDAERVGPLLEHLISTLSVVKTSVEAEVKTPH